MLAASAGLLGLPLPATALDLTAGSGAAQGCPATGRGVVATISAIGWLEPAPVVLHDNYGGDRYAPADGTNRGFGIGFAELAGAAYGVCVGAVYRHEYHGRASRDLLDAVRGNHLEEPFDSGRTYSAFMDFDGLQAAGVRVRKVLDYQLSPAWGLRVGIGVSLLKGVKGQHQSVQGSVLATSASWATGAGTWLRLKSNRKEEGFNPYVYRGNPRGIGYSSDVELFVRSRSGWEIDLTVMDLYGRVHWHDVPTALKALNSSSISYNANLDQNASITGVDSILAYKQHIKPKYRLALASRPVQGWSLMATDDAVGRMHFPAAGIRYSMRSGQIDASYDLRTRAATLAWKNSGLQLSATMDDPRTSRAHVLGLVMSAASTW